MVPVAPLRDLGVLVDPLRDLILRPEPALDELARDDRVEHERAAQARLEAGDHRLSFSFQYARRYSAQTLPQMYDTVTVLSSLS